MIKKYTQTVLAPRIQADGGWVEYVSQNGRTLHLAFRGECSKCPVLDRCAEWMAGQIREACGEDVVIVPLRRKPFFWDTVC